MMSTDWLVTVIDVGRVGFEFLINWFMQSTLLIGVGLLIGVILRHQEAVLKSVVYRVTLAFAILCPLATLLLADENQAKFVDAQSHVYQRTVVDPNGKPVAGAKIYIPAYATKQMGLLEANWKPVTVTNVKGEFRFIKEDLIGYENVLIDRSDYFNVCATADGYGFAWSNSTVLETSGAALEKLRERLANFSEESRAELLKMIESAGKPMQLVVDDQPIQGQVLTVEGQPVKDAKVSLIEVSQGRNGTLDGWLEKTKESRTDFYSSRLELQSINGPQIRSFIAPISTDADGKFVVRGIGRERIARLLIEGPNIESDMIYARTRSGELIELPHQLGQGTERDRYHSNELTHVAGPSQSIAGVVMDKVTKQPIPRALVLSQKRHGHPVFGSGQDFIRTLTDSEGHFRLEGMPIGDDNVIGVIAPTGAAYIATSTKAKTTADPQPLQLDFEVQPGVWVAGRVTDKQTGEGLSGKFERFTFKDNPVMDRNRVDERAWLVSGADGRFRIVVAPGHGILAFNANRHEKYPRSAGSERIVHDRESGGGTLAFRTFPHACTASNFHALAEINFSLEQKEVELNFVLDASNNLQGQVVDPSGKPIPTGLFAGKLKEFPVWERLQADARFEIVNYAANDRWPLAFIDRDRCLAALVDGSEPLPNPFVVKLQPAGMAKGRIVDEHGDAIPNLQLSSWRPPTADKMSTHHQTYKTWPLPPGDSKAFLNRFITDAEGRFEFVGLIPDQEYRVRVSSHATNGAGRVLGALDVVIKVNAGEKLNLGDVRIADEKTFREKFEMSMQADK